MKYAWIDAQRKSYPLPAMCETLSVSTSGYRAWKRGGSPGRKRLTDAQLLALITAIHKELKGAYGSPRMVRELRARGFPASKPRVERLMRHNGNCWDNAPTESFFNSLKNERVHGTRYATRAQAVADLFDYIEVFYNRSRRHSTLGYRSPVQFLQDWIRTQHERKIAA